MEFCDADDGVGGGDGGTSHGGGGGGGGGGLTLLTQPGVWWSSPRQTRGRQTSGPPGAW